ncbi:MAG: Uma2 family endonuclease [Candidatus Competibacterales bacterium]
MAENTLQYRWLVKIKENLEILFADDNAVFIAGDLFWYPHPDRRVSGPVAPDVMVVFGRPKGDRGSYRQWEEGGIAPQVVFEIRSPGNSLDEMRSKQAFYDHHGVEEYYVYDPEANRLEVWLRQDGRLVAMSHLHGWTSPRLQIRFVLTQETLEIFDPKGRPFLSSVELAQRLDQTQRAVEQERKQAEEARLQAQRERQRADQLAAQLRALGVDPDQL